MALLWPLAALASPSATQPQVEDQPHRWVRGGAISTMHGPTGFGQNTNRRGPSLRVQRISIRVELHADLALVEQTYTIENPDDGTPATLGVLQPNPKLSTGIGIQTYRPTAPVAYLDNVRLPDENVVEESAHVTGPGGGPGYRIGISAHFPMGTSSLTLMTVVQTVNNTLTTEHDATGSTAPWSWFSLQCHYYSWGWTPEDAVAQPTVVTSLEIMDDVDVTQVVAEQWTEGAAGSPRQLWWRHTPWFAVRYLRDRDAAPPPTSDALRARARELLDAAPVGHLNVPENLRPATRPGIRDALPAQDPSRARRALVVPIIALLLVLVIGYLILVRRRQGSSQL